MVRDKIHTTPMSSLVLSVKNKNGNTLNKRSVITVKLRWSGTVRRTKTVLSKVSPPSSS